VIYFISDLHLSPQTPGAVAILERFLAGIAQPENQLFILGDFFEAWVGDDSTNDPVVDGSFNRKIVALLAKASASGLKIGLQHGNRDFLLGERFAKATGLNLLPDPYVLSTPEWQFVLSHGDTLCTDDTAYQAFRSQVRTPEWQALFLAKPLNERLAIARQMREHSSQQHQKNAEKSQYSADLNISETDDFLRQHGYATFIHGHTHQPAIHDHIVDGIHVERWVLADWHEDCGEALCWDGEHLFRQVLR
jgi:UDP-2,3-diacylglucosamine hydrolase